jgi:hypothetical protein
MMTLFLKLRRPAVALALLAAPALATAQTMGSYTGPLCPPPGQVFERPTPACGAAPLHAGLFKVGRFQVMSVQIGTSCLRQEVFIGCK